MSLKFGKIATMFIRTLFLILIFLSYVVPLRSDESASTDHTRLGLFGNFNYNLHSADFKKLPNCPSCSPGYRSGSGTGISFGILFEQPFSALFRAGLRLRYNSHNGKLTSTDTTTILYSDYLETGRFEYRLDAIISSFDIEPYTQFNIFPHTYIGIGLSLGFISASTFSQSERLVFPVGSGTFLDSNGNDTKKRTRNELSGDIPNVVNTLANLNFNISYEVPLNKTKSILAEPRLNYSLALNNLVESDEVNKWKINQLSGGISVKYVFLPTKEIFKKYEKIDRIDTLRKELESIKSTELKIGITSSKKDITVSDNVELTTEIFQRTDTLIIPVVTDLKPFITAFGVDSLGNEIQEPVFKIEEFISAKIQPVLNYIFFDEGSSVIPKRYNLLSKIEVPSFKEADLFHSTTLQTYYELLNVIGNRLNKIQTANIKLVGCNDGGSSAKEDIEISLQRAESVKRYLTEVWKISSERIKIESRNLPEKASTPIDELEKIEENRRVEIYADNEAILRPIQYTDTLRIITPPTIRFKTDIISSKKITDADIIVKHDDKVIKILKSNSSSGKFTDWKLDEDIMIMKNVTKDLTYKFLVKDSKNNIASTLDKTIQFNVTTVKQKKREKKGDKEIDRFSLILFDFDKADLNAANLKILEDIKRKIKNNSDVYITGHTDRTGDDNYNLKLSIERAFTVKKALGVIKAIAEGQGEKVILHDNDLPEGRFFCRTVNIIVETKLK